MRAENESTIVTRTEKKNSYEFGKASNRHKVYYDDVEELDKLVKELRNAGYLDEF